MTEEVFCSFFWVGSQLASHGGHGFQRRENPPTVRNLELKISLKCGGDSAIKQLSSTPPLLGPVATPYPRSVIPRFPGIRAKIGPSAHR